MRPPLSPLCAHLPCIFPTSRFPLCRHLSGAALARPPSGPRYLFSLYLPLFIGPTVLEASLFLCSRSGPGRLSAALCPLIDFLALTFIYIVQQPISILLAEYMRFYTLY